MPDMTKKTWTARYEGLEILVENTWIGGTHLFVDGVLKDSNTKLAALSKTKPRLEATVTINGTTKSIQVFIVAWVFVRAKICVDGVRIGGDDF